MNLDKEFFRKACIGLFKKEINSKENTKELVLKQLLDSQLFDEAEMNEIENEMQNIIAFNNLVTLTCFIDGGVRLSQHGHAKKTVEQAASAFIVKNGEAILLKKSFEIPSFYGKDEIKTATSSHIAEYQALLSCLSAIKSVHPLPEHLNITVNTDSDIVFKQIQGHSATRPPVFRDLKAQIHEVMLSFQKVTVSYVPRECNMECDRLIKSVIGEERI